MPESIPWKDPKKPHPDLVYGSNVIATSEPHATEAGWGCFKDGGNAVDAALAAAITLTVTEPCSNGIGGDGFAIVARNSKLYGLNASGKSPKSWTRDYFNRYGEMPERGWDTVTTPGAVSQWVTLHHRFGQLPFARLFEPAIHHARNGFSLGKRVAEAFNAARESFDEYPELLKTWFPEGRTLEAGQHFGNPDQADTLQEIASTGGESFYRGRLAKKIAEYAQASGGWLTQEDLASHQPTWVDPISAAYRDCEVHEIPPNGQGIVTLIALGILNQFPLNQWDPESPDSIHLKMEAIKVAFAEAFQHVCDPDGWNESSNTLLSRGYFKERAARISLSQASQPEPTHFQDHGTVYLSAADASGTMVSYIQSNYMGFGSGIVIPDTGILLQNRGHGFNLIPGHPNEVAPGKRPFHTIIPAMVTHRKNPLFSFGVMGGHMQPQGQVQVLTRILDNEWNPQASADAPRWFVTPDCELVFEDGFDPRIIEDLKNRGHPVRTDQKHGMWGGYQGIYKLSHGYCGSSEMRKDGCAKAFR